MEKKTRFKKQINSYGKVTWSFQAFRTTRRGFKTKREAQLAYLELEKVHRSRKNLVGFREKFSVVGEQWYNYYRLLDEQKESTYIKRWEMLQILNRWIGDMELIELSPDYLEELFFQLKKKGIDGSSQGYAKNTLYSIRQTLNMVLKYCLKKNMLNVNPLSGLPMPKYKKSVDDLKQSLESLDNKYLTIEELRTLLNYSTVHEELPLSTLFYVLFYTGCRISEALAIQPEDIDFEKNEILFYKQTATKGKQSDFKISRFQQLRLIVQQEELLSPL